MFSSNSGSSANSHIINENKSNFLKKHASHSFMHNSKSKNSSAIYSDIKESKTISKPPFQKLKPVTKRNNVKEGIPFKKKFKSDILPLQKEVSAEHEQSNLFQSSVIKTYVCKFCCRQFKTEEQLQQHVKIHDNEPSHSCYLCNYQTASFSALMNHFIKHSGQKINKHEKIFPKSKEHCPKLKFNSSSKEKQAFYCQNCKLSFNLKSKLDAHKCPVGLAKEVYKCTYCGRVSSSVEEYRTCVQSHTETPFICSNCKTKFQRKKQLDLHLQSCKVKATLSSSFKCDKCKCFSCNTKRELEVHLKNCKKITETFTCSNCYLEFSEKKGLEEHLMHCEMAFKEKSLDSKPQVLPKKTRKYVKKKIKYSCSSCKAPFFLKSEYLKHEKNCLKVISFDANESVSKACTKCGSLIQIGKLAEHAKVCLNKTVKKSNAQESEKDLCFENGGEVKNSIAYKQKADACQSDNENKYEVKSNIANQIPCNQENNHKPKADKSADKLKNSDEKSGSRRSTRLVRRKSSFMDDDDNEDEEILKKRRKSVKIRISKKPRVMIKPKFRRGKYSGESNKSFVCNICDFAFCSKSTLLRHKRMHSGNPWYTCKYCGKFFFRKDVYVRHEVNVHKDAEQKIYCCCYCKLCYNDASSLKDHVTEAHKDSAFLPIRPRMYTKRSTNVLEIKQESKDGDDTYNLDESRLNEKTNRDLASSLDFPFKCSICPKTFEMVSEIAKHMATHSDSQLADGCNGIENKKDLLSLKTSSSIKFTEAPLTNPKLAEIPSGKVSENNGDHMKHQETFQKNSVVDELIPDENMIQVDAYGSLECLLCKQKFSNKTLLEAHNKTDHKMIEWYQCLVCSASGSKQDMVEHMFSHMYKVGTFVVNCNDKNWNSILPCLELEKTPVSSGRNVPQTSASKMVDSNFSDMNNLVLDLELPPLREYGICSCMTDNSDAVVEDISNKVDNSKNENTAALESFNGDSLLDDKNDSNKSELIAMQNHDQVVSKLENFSQNLVVDKKLNTDKDNLLVQEGNEGKLSRDLGSDDSSLKESDFEKDKADISPFPELEAQEKIGEEVSNCEASNDNDISNTNLSSVSLNKESSIHDSPDKEHTNIVISSDTSSSSSDGKSVASNSSNTEENESEQHSSSDDDESKTESSSSDSSSQNSSTENDSDSSDASSSDKEEDLANSFPASSSVKEATVNSLMPSTTSLLEKEEVKLDSSSQLAASTNENKSFQCASPNKSFLSPDRINNPDVIASNAFFSKDQAPAVSGASVSTTCSYSENMKNSVDFLSFGKGNPSSTEVIKQTTSSSFNFENQVTVTASQPSEKEPELFKSIFFPTAESHETVHSFASDLIDQNAKGKMNKFDISSSCGSLKQLDVPLLFDLYPKENEAKSKDILPSSTLSEDKTISVTRDPSNSSQGSELPLNLQKSEHLSDFQTESFSQLRYLLQKPSKLDSEKITIYPLSYTDSSVTQGASTPFVKCVSSIENQEFFDSSFILDNKCDFSMSSPSKISSNKTKVEPQILPHNDQNIPLNPDYNEPKRKFSESLEANVQNKQLENAENFFKPCSSQNPILDFSDFIQHSFENPSPCEENIFSYSETVKTGNLHQHREEIRTPDCTAMANYDSSAFNASSKCSICYLMCETNDQLLNHKCILPKTVKYTDSYLGCKPKITFQSSDFAITNKVPPAITHGYQDKLMTSTSDKAAEPFGSVKAYPSEFEIKKLPKSHQNTQMHPISNSKCNKCHATFNDIGELMKHSLTCLKPLFFRNTHPNDCMTTVGALDSLGLKEPMTSFSDFSFTGSLPITTASSGSTTTYQTFGHIKHPFGS